MAGIAMVLKAMTRDSLTGKRMAITMEISPQQLSNQIAEHGKEQLGFWRMLLLSSEFWAELLPLIADYHGLTLGDSPQQRQDAEVGKLVREAVLRVVAR